MEEYIKYKQTGENLIIITSKYYGKKSLTILSQIVFLLRHWIQREACYYFVDCSELFNLVSDVFLSSSLLESLFTKNQNLELVTFNPQLSVSIQ